ncbi:MAG: hypothetical protein AUI16_18560 [Alphaproteobacteria bacterium 13_2_20CM_2_64_7]|nr:MAG: hypothetical protein AUI16_18560 [Alphaproteobacteria bacterium 13_2_20CM_2_64_7]
MALEVKLPVPYGADKTMRIIIAFASVLLSGAALADSVRHPSVPERLWGTWAPSADLCTDSKSTFVVSAKGYVTSQANCAIQWLSAGPDFKDLKSYRLCPTN